MATPRTRWLLSILLVNLPNCFAQGPTAAPSHPECCIPCGEINNCADIHCSWDPRLDPQIPTNYSLHWEPEHTEVGHVISGTSLDWIIPREHFNSGKLRVWVQAKNQLGSAKSLEVVFNTADIIKLPPPKVTSSHQEELEISWNSTCDEQQLSAGPCDVRFQREADQDWLQDGDIIHGSYTINSPQACTIYEIQVRCSCDIGLKSDWSASHRIRSPETAPVGELDVWQDCGISQESSDCVLAWKKLPISAACGVILGYEARLSYNNGTLVLVNVSVAEPKDSLVCGEMQCHFTTSLKGVSTVSISAYNAQGATVPSYLAMPIPEKTEQAIHLTMNEENLTVSWGLSTQLSDNLKEYVVQYKQAGGPPGQGFDWVKVKKNQTTGLFKGRYTKYTPYKVSLFTLSHSREVHHLSSVIGYSLEGSPSSVPSFQVFSIAATQVTLFWKSVPLSKQNGVILYYQIVADSRVDGQNVYNVSAPPNTFKLLHLSPGQEYEVRIRAVTAAGAGVNATAKFKTKHLEDFGHVIFRVVSGILSLVVICVATLYCACRGEKKACLPCFYYKVPDARNSQIFRNKNQINDPWASTCIPIYEPHPKISLLEVVEVQRWAFKSSLEKSSNNDRLTRPLVGDECSQMDCKEDQKEEAAAEECPRTDHRYGREEYSKMVDSDEERDREEENREDCWSSSEENQSTSGYEKHFMPTACEVLKV
ncbi:interleukin 12 receptor, beta 2a, like isoform X2 [Cottoperca gobio]|uniref:Interleukin 12 receptor, beta 2a, like isoform X2 n=1 Tax=Cottoperca gobio TaxID=56716 RepID=A0A6J2Q805_COTGO|nr:interleukin-12 receptor subunit beta-2-like isoform X2 [Cottoperca gobio]